MMSRPGETPPSSVPWPPILIALTVVVGRLLDFSAPAQLPEGLSPAGAALALLAIGNDLWCARTLWRRKTTVMPHRIVSQLVTDGPYRFSRNPIYISHVALTIAIGLMLRSFWILALTPALVFGLVKLSIEPEERHLASKFGEEFRAYAARVRRWL